MPKEKTLSSYSEHLDHRAEWKNTEVYNLWEKMCYEKHAAVDPDTFINNLNINHDDVYVQHSIKFDLKGIQQDDYKGLHNISLCPFCLSNLSQAGDTVRSMLTYLDFSYVGTDVLEDLRYCKTCGWWILVKYSFFVEFYLRCEVYEGILKKLPETNCEYPMNELRNYLLKNPDKIYSLNPRKFEELVGDVFSDFYNCEVRHIGGPGDNGIDLYCIDNSESPVFIQVKRRMNSEAVEGPEVVREMIGSLLLKEGKRGLIVSTAKKFSPGAYDTIKAMNLKTNGKIELELIDFTRLIVIMNMKKKSNLLLPWEGLTHKTKLLEVKYI